MTGYEAILFDSDGVLVEPPSADAQASALRTAFREVGVTDVPRRHVDAICAGVTDDGLRDICTAHGIDPEAFWAAREARDEESQFDEFRGGVRRRYDDVDAIPDLPQPRGVVSNNHHSTIAFVLEFFDLEPLFETFYGRPKTIESLRLKKPNPHYLERAAADLGAEPESTLYVGDSESDVVAADRAGMGSAFVRRSHRRDVDLSIDPTYEVETLYDVAALADVDRP